ncbi:helix-turn-helix transcriptional regulator [Maricaulis alexandrii]|uniref:helix-turn-helix transcriptional regulator n=1 Tax=Maricaulis alexandrii TaxID=2570354 RepID=UPI001109A49D|nr:LuxR C-terminal-related transcriptional regulator [Maricaulis alexandrii]
MLTDDERRELKAWQSRQAFAVFLLVVFVFPGLFYGLWSLLVDPAGFFSSMWIVLVPALVFWAVLLRQSPKRWWLARKDIQEGLADQCSGSIEIRERRGIGVFAPSRQVLHVANRQFELPPFWSEQITPGLGYRVRFGRHSQAILSISRRPATREGVPSDAPLLTSRETALLRLLAQGLTDKDIARELNLSPTTVRTYNSELYLKIGIQRRTQVRALAEAWGLLDD